MSQPQAGYVTKDELQEGLDLLRGESRQIEASTSGFTPCPDLLVQKYSHTTAMIWGKIWRFCQMPEEVCRAAIQRIADELNLSTNTIAKHISLLESGGYIQDTTPDLRNKPHIYVDTGKMRLKISLWMAESGTQNLRSETSKTEVEESTTNRGEVQKNVFTLYESNIGPLTPIIADQLKDAENTYVFSWIEEAITLSVTNNKRNWRYCETILKRWKESGKDDGKGKPETKAQPEQKTELELFMEKHQ